MLTPSTTFFCFTFLLSGAAVCVLQLLTLPLWPIARSTCRRINARLAELYWTGMWQSVVLPSLSHGVFPYLLSCLSHTLLYVSLSHSFARALYLSVCPFCLLVRLYHLPVSSVCLPVSVSFSVSLSCGIAIPTPPKMVPYFLSQARFLTLCPLSRLFISLRFLYYRCGCSPLLLRLRSPYRCCGCVWPHSMTAAVSLYLPYVVEFLLSLCRTVVVSLASKPASCGSWMCYADYVFSSGALLSARGVSIHMCT